MTPGLLLFILLAILATITYAAVTGIAAGRKWDADLPALDEPLPYRCRVSGHYFRAVPQMAGITHHVWKCATCGEFVKVGKTVLYDQDAS